MIRNIWAKAKLWAAIPVAFLVSASFFARDGEQASQHVLAQKRDLLVQVNTIGTLDAARSYVVSSGIKGNNAKIIQIVKDGAWVKEGDVLVRFDSTPFEAELLKLNGDAHSLAAVVDKSKQLLEWQKNDVEREIKAAEFELKSSELELTQLVKGDGPMKIIQLEQEYTQAEEEYKKYTGFKAELEELAKKGYSYGAEIKKAKEKLHQLEMAYERKKTEYDSYKDYVLPSQVEEARTKVSRAEMELERAKKGSEFKIASAMASLNQSKTELENVQEKQNQAKIEISKTTVSAPFDGIVVLYEMLLNGEKRVPMVGDALWQNQPILYLPDTSTFVIRTKVREVDLHKVKIGDKAMVKVDAFPDLELAGTVAMISALAEKTIDSGREKYFLVTLEADVKSNTLRPGMTARISIEGGSVKDAVTIPVQAIYPEGDAKYCYKYDGQKYSKVRIVLGAQNEDFAEVKSGLLTGDRVSLVIPEHL